MNISYGLHKNFVGQLNKVREKYGEQLMELNGIGMKQLGYTDFINNFIKTKTTAADISIDANSNVSVMDMSTMLKEMFKPQEKLLSLNKIYLEMIEDWGLIDTNNWIEQELIGGLYLHDGYEASFLPYCYNYSMKDLVEKGMVFDEILKAESPKHLDSFNQHVLEFVGYATNRQSGSVGLGDYLVWSYYFWYKDKKNQYMGITDFEIYKNQQFQMFVYALNQSWAKNNQSAFSNVSLFDRNYLISLFAEEKFPDGTDIIDHCEEIISYQKDFLNWLKIERSKKLLTFPILSAALLYQEEKFIDEDFARFISDHIYIWKDISIMSENDITSMSSCCFTKDTKVLVDKNGIIESCRMDQIENGEKVKLYNRNKWDIGKKIELPNKKMLKITTHNGQEIITTYDHIHVTEEGNKAAINLTTENYLCFNEKEILNLSNKKYPMEDNYLFGKLIGIICGDGNFDMRENMIANIKFCLNYNTKQHLVSDIEIVLNNYDLCLSEYISNSGIGESVPIYGIVNKNNEKNKYRIIFMNLIETFIHIGTAHQKYLTNECLNMSNEFKQGILDGYYQTDGGTSNRIYSVNKKLIDTFGEIINTIGYCFNIDVDNRKKTLGGKLSDNPIFCIRFYKKSIKSQRPYYIRKNGEIFFRIKNIELYDYNDTVHCFEMEDIQNQYFMLSNGLLTHNCRLKSSAKTLGLFNSVAGSNLSIGSIKVSTINMNRIALDSNCDKEKFLDILRLRTELNLKMLKTHRKIISKNIEKGLLPIYTNGLMKLANQYSTFGIASFGDMMETLGLLKKDAFENYYYDSEAYEFGETVFKIIDETIDNFKFDFMINKEQIPAEGMAVTVLKKDKIFYPDKITTNLYSNQWLSLSKQSTMMAKIESASIFDKYCSGGSMLFINVEGQFNNKEQTWSLINLIAKNNVVTFNIVTKINICENEHNYTEISNICPICGAIKKDEATRIVGYYTRRSKWQKERKEEERIWFNFNN